MPNRPILITGGGTFLGDAIAVALLAEGATITLLVRPGVEEKLGLLAQQARWQTADVWDSASLRGRARGHSLVIHTVGSLVADPAQGLTYHRMNFVSARNVISMCVGDGVPHLILLSGVGAPWISRQYIHAKREAEAYLGRVGLQGTIIRAPLAYVRGQRRPFFYELVSLFGAMPPLSWTKLRQIAPLPVDVLARGVARIAIDPDRAKTIYYARDLWRRNTKAERSGRVPLPSSFSDDTSPSRPRAFPFQLLQEDSPFGWIPPDERD